MNGHFVSLLSFYFTRGVIEISINAARACETVSDIDINENEATTIRMSCEMLGKRIEIFKTLGNI